MKTLYPFGIPHRDKVSPSMLRTLIAAMWLTDRRRPVTIRGLCRLTGTSPRNIQESLQRLAGRGFVRLTPGKCAATVVLVRFIPTEELP